MNNFIFGFTYPLKSVKLFFKYPKLLGYSVIPMILNLIIYGSVFYFVFTFITGKTEDFFTQNISDKFLLGIIRLLLHLFTFILILILCYFLFIVFGGLISAPFNEKISRLIEEKEFGKSSGYDLPFFKDISFSLKAELKKLTFYFSIILPIILVDFIPMIGSIITLIFGTAFSFYYNALDYLDYPMTRRLYPFRKKLRTINSKLSLSMGFGGMAFFLTFLPVINVFMVPILVTAGTSLFYQKDFLKEQKESKALKT